VCGGAEDTDAPRRVFDHSEDTGERRPRFGSRRSHMRAALRIGCAGSRPRWCARAGERGRCRVP
jgi:hypothetical protein